MSLSVSIPFVLNPSITPRIPLPCSVSAIITSTGFDVAQNILHTSDKYFILFKLVFSTSNWIS